ncbi:peptidase M15B and M15C DD-carboxypeptidase VanY/endolysin [Yersinia pseudotuberculosis]|uniref:M15 family metallopeptidase n=1 Tax=Yersinia pseudotuberculosis TaxID=633 RepID=UPI0005DD58A5|nr:M15 family metallopeptidase [Yersinia pseudotuberculosis]BET62242.1 M15 family metallopeptidase [Yersinia pseudotuberculosis]CFV21491.1 peptidase M15B and M15C DD-carboxypeptidase VanY/endolysin [Yersinia pseudotuberculosis]CNK58937.1 peptidase M15B and M15C DD-carboxypeptidase VanY/endolysin [Yersinia pseudotuberculosis]
MKINNFRFSQRSENNLKGVNADLVKVVRRALDLSSVDFGVIEGLRTVERQRELFNAVPKKTQTMNSRHITGHAIDLLPTGADWNDYKCWLPVLDAMHCAGKELGVKLRFGVTWTDNPNDKPAKFLDAPHIEIST